MSGGASQQQQRWYTLYDFKKIMKFSEKGGIRTVQGFTGSDFRVTTVVGGNQSLVIRFVGCAQKALGGELPRYPVKGVIRFCLYFTNRKQEIVQVVYDPNGEHLLIATKANDIYLVTLARVLFHKRTVVVDSPDVPRLGGFLQIPKTNVSANQDVTKLIEISELRVKGRDKVQIGKVTSIVWWRNRSGGDHAVVACDGGFIVIIDLVTRKEILCAPIPIRPHDLHLASSPISTTLLVVGTRGASTDLTNHVYRLPLELSPGVHHLPWKDITYLRCPRSTTPLSPVPTRSPHLPTAVAEISGLPTAQIWIGPLGHGRSGIFVYQPSVQEIRCYDPFLADDACSAPLYVFCVGAGASMVRVTNGLVMFAHGGGAGHQKISMLSRFGASSSTRGRSGDYNCLQELMLGQKQLVMGFVTPSSSQSSDSTPEPVELWTENTLYELSPTADPVLLFKATMWAGCSRPPLEPSKLIHHAEALAKAFNLDIIELYKQSAKLCAEKSPKWALQLYSLVEMEPREQLRRLVAGSSDEDVYRFIIKHGVRKFCHVLFWVAVRGLVLECKHAVDPVGDCSGSFVSMESIETPRSSSTRSLGGRPGSLAEGQSGHPSGSWKASAQATAASVATTDDDPGHNLASPYSPLGCPNSASYLTPTTALLTSLSLATDEQSLLMIDKLLKLGMLAHAVSYAASSQTLANHLLNRTTALSIPIPPHLLSKLTDVAPYSLSCSPLLHTLPWHHQLLVLINTRQYTMVPTIAMKVQKVAALKHASEAVPALEVELKVLLLMRVAEVLEQEGAVGHEYDDEACLKLDEEGWDTARVKKYCEWTKRARVAGKVEMIVGNYVKSVVWVVIWVGERYKGEKEKQADVIIEWVKEILFGPHHGVTQADKRSCLRVLLEAWARMQLDVEGLVDFFKQFKVEKELLGVLTTTPKYLKSLPMAFKVSLLRGVKPISLPARADPPAASPDRVAIPLRSTRPLVVFSCNHLALPVSTYATLMQNFATDSCPLSSTVIRSTSEKMSKGTCSTVAQACPRCICDSFEVPYPPRGNATG
eukprot:TRINITY_DN4456_c0_g1_i1.p1 TRINITY_DN4456_c0_g1~~TRINITY_DN4456_c0_g1_i1.p1  ORF type:complete len:1045 (+),score=181.77 TRINITY_DN4456_c0_g1_i1:88-3222(+)